MNVSIENVINISVSQAGQGAGEYNTSNLAIFTHEKPASSFGTDGYKLYLEPSDVATDFGSDSIAYKKALAVFSQQPNILANNGYLVVILMESGSQTLEFSAAPDEGALVLNFGSENISLLFSDTNSELQTKLRTISGLENVVVTGSFASDFVIEMIGTPYQQSITLGANTLELSNAPVTPLISANDGELLKDAIVRSEGIIQYFGLMVTALLSQVELLEVGAVIQPIRKIGFFGSRTEADINSNGKFDLVRQASLSQTRCLYYGSTSDESVMIFTASYAGRALSTNFNGTNTTQTMHLKDLVGVLPDPSMTQTILNKAKLAGADIYASIQGIPKVFTSGANRFFDDVYNLLWFVGALQIAGFNVLAQTGTKIAQTEQGVDSLKSSYREVCERAVNNQFVAAGRWTSPNTFGVQGDFFDNISQRGYYIYSLPVGLQSPTSRANREAPLIQLAVKYAGAIHSSNVIVNVNA